MVRFTTHMAVRPDTRSALDELDGQIEGGVHASLAVAFYDADHDDALIASFLNRRFPDAAIIGGTSCGGTMTAEGLGGPGSLGLLIVDDADGNYGSAAVKFEGDPADCAEAALRAALIDADCEGELPELIWVYQAPGREEDVIAGLRRIVGERCPIIGGSSADNRVEGRWRQLGSRGPLVDGLVVAVLFTSGGLGFAFQGGYEPTGEQGLVTEVADCPADHGEAPLSGGRQILTIDGEPAARVYDRWLGGALQPQLAEGGSVLAQTTMDPLGVDAGEIEDVRQYLLIHPDRVLANGGLATFAAVSAGTRVYAMRGDRSRLIERAGKVAASAVVALPGGQRNLAGALIVYCAGCMIAVGEDMPAVADTLATTLGGQPFLGCFTFGEQGFMMDRNAHGNLMISAVVFGK